MERLVMGPARRGEAGKAIRGVSGCGQAGGDDVDELIAELKEMARRIGAEFVPDKKKIADFRKGRRDKARS